MIHCLAAPTATYRALQTSRPLKALTPTMDHLFDRGFISYEDSGLLIVSPVAHPPSLNLMGVATNRILNVGTFYRGPKAVS
jgi:hypothetical protein